MVDLIVRNDKNELEAIKLKISDHTSFLVAHKQKLRELKDRNNGNHTPTSFRFKTVVNRYKQELRALIENSDEIEGRIEDKYEEFDEETGKLEDKLTEVIVEILELTDED